VLLRKKALKNLKAGNEIGKEKQKHKSTGSLPLILKFPIFNFSRGVMATA
jgi:hypothetical protein